jgi:hypothetical protein
MSYLKIDRVVKSFPLAGAREALVLNDIRLNIEKGEFVRQCSRSYSQTIISAMRTLMSFALAPEIPLAATAGTSWRGVSSLTAARRGRCGKARKAVVHAGCGRPPSTPLEQFGVIALRRVSS